MPSFDTEVPHSLGKEKARALLEQFIEVVKNRYQDQVSDMSGEWTGETLNYSFKAYGFTISGVVTCEDNRVHLTGQIPLAAAMFKGRIEESIRTEVEKVLSRGEK
mgnify:CR=1 FL=1